MQFHLILKFAKNKRIWKEQKSYATNALRKNTSSNYVSFFRFSLNPFWLKYCCCIIKKIIDA